MTGKIVNLNRVRKSRARVEARREADANAAKFGRSRAEKQSDKARRALEQARLDGHRREEE